MIRFQILGLRFRSRRDLMREIAALHELLTEAEEERHRLRVRLIEAERPRDETELRSLRQREKQFGIMRADMLRCAEVLLGSAARISPRVSAAPTEPRAKSDTLTGGCRVTDDYALATT